MQITKDKKMCFFILILIIVFILLLIFINNNNVIYEGNSDNKQINYKLTEENQMSISKLEEMRKIQRGTSYIEIVSRFGEPDEELGSGFLIVGYKFSESKLVLHFLTGESLQGLWEIGKDGTTTVYIPL